ncbi:hypothetical protein [Psychrobacillus psychrodurans]|nr:hypothetical protein [Psychrobacillus psychrodurans]
MRTFTHHSLFTSQELKIFGKAKDAFPRNSSSDVGGPQDGGHAVVAT